MNRIVNGIETIISPAEEAEILAEWAFNESLPKPDLKAKQPLSQFENDAGFVTTVPIDNSLLKKIVFELSEQGFKFEDAEIIELLNENISVT